MRYMQIGKSDLKASTVALGTWAIGGSTKQKYKCTLWST